MALEQAIGAGDTTNPPEQQRGRVALVEEPRGKWPTSANNANRAAWARDTVHHGIGALKDRAVSLVIELAEPQRGIAQFDAKHVRQRRGDLVDRNLGHVHVV